MQAYQQTEESHQAEGSAAQFSYLLCEISGDVIDQSPGWLNIWGWDKESTTGRSLLDFVDSSDHKDLLLSLGEVVARKKNESQVAVDTILKNGKRMPAAVYFRTIANSAGIPLYISVVIIPANPDFATFRIVANAIHAINNSLLVITGTANRLVKLINRDQKDLDLESTKTSLGKVDTHGKKVESILAELRKKLDPNG